VAPLVGAGVIPKEAAEDCLKAWQSLLKQDNRVSLLKVMVKKGLLTRTQAIVLSGAPIEAAERQPFFPNYKLVRRVGEGGMAIVYEATYQKVTARVALKVLMTKFCLQEAYRLRFKREANILLNLDHPNIVEGREYDSFDGVDFYAMGYVDGISVLDILEHGIPIGEGLALHIAAQVASALEHMREKGIVHRDIKPGNLVLDPDGNVKIIDFGLAKVMTGMWQDVGTETTVGTIDYMSPEQARGETNVDTRADVYSLGVTLFHMATGELPFQGTAAEIMYGHVKTEVAFTPAQRAKISDQTQYILRRTMAKDPAHRYETPKALEDDIHALCDAIIEGRDAVPEVVTKTSVEAAPIQLPPPKPKPVAPASQPRARPGQHRTPPRRPR
jgi:serine/threonine-protein kinase